jgi:hypothetical protein
MRSKHPAIRMDGSGGGRYGGVSLWDGASEQSLARAAFGLPVANASVDAVD